MAQLTCKNLTLGYDNRAIQEDLNFSIDAGDYLCIVGENGSGKSTLMKTLLHLQAPVSYTHLDVYKRQDYFCLRYPVTADGCLWWYYRRTWRSSPA